jgi:hypothetical protein
MKDLELFNLYVKSAHPTFYKLTDGRGVLFCDGVPCSRCCVRKHCAHYIKAPRLSDKEYLQITRDNPEYLI